jgi:Tfp pilus assembly protein PilV
VVLSRFDRGGAGRRERERGSTVVEALITFGLLASVLLSSLGLFSFGERQLRSARAASQALILARGILEETSAWSFTDTWARFGVDGSQSSCTIDTRQNAFAAKWQSDLSAAIPGSSATVEVASLAFGGVTAPLAETKGLRIVVTVAWDEAARHREVRLGTARF